MGRSVHFFPGPEITETLRQTVLETINQTITETLFRLWALETGKILRNPFVKIFYKPTC